MSAETQLDLFQEYKLGAAHLSRVIPQWDLLPLYLFSPCTELPPDTPISAIPALHHKFTTHKGERLTVHVEPAIIRDSAGGSRIVFAGEREQLVAAAVRALAVRQQAAMGTRKGGKGQSLITIAFTVRQIRAELATAKHTFSHAEIIEALTILAAAKVVIFRERDGEKPIRDPQNYYTSSTSQEENYIVTLNELESEQILAGAYRAIDYDQVMEFRDPLTRWLYQYIHVEHRGAKKPGEKGWERGFEISLQMLLDRGQFAKTRQLRDLVPRVRRSLDRLTAAGVLHTDDATGLKGYSESLVTTPTAGRRRIVDAIWQLFVSTSTVEFIIDAHAEAKPRDEVFKHLRLVDRLAHSDTARANLAKKRRTAKPSASPS